MNSFSWTVFAALSNAEEDNVALQMRVAVGDSMIVNEKFASGDTVHLSIESAGHSFDCNTYHNFALNVEYKQIDLPKFDGRDEFSEQCETNQVRHALRHCAAECADPDKRPGCTGFFFQKHQNSHEICGFYYTAVDSLNLVKHGHQGCSQVCTLAPAPCASQKITGAVPGVDCVDGAFPIERITGSHTVHMELTMPPDLEANEQSVRQWILNMGQTAQFSHHWLWSPKGQPGSSQQASVQFGPSGAAGQIEVFNATKDKTFDAKSSGELLANAESLTATYSAETGIYTLYMDTQLVASSYVGQSLSFSSNTLLVAQRASACRFFPDDDFKGCVLKVAVWDCELKAWNVAGLNLLD